jgi:hypothetical protein
MTPPHNIPYTPEQKYKVLISTFVAYLMVSLKCDKDKAIEMIAALCEIAGKDLERQGVL